MTTSSASTVSYCILFDGKLADGKSRPKVINAIAKLTNSPEDEVLESLFSVRPVIVNQVNTLELAQKYVNAFSDCGLIVWHELSDEEDELLNAELSFGHYAPLERVEAAPNYVIDTEERAADEDNSKPAPSSSYSRYFSVLFDGDLQPKAEKSTVVSNISSLTRTTEAEVLEQLFAVRPVIVIESGSKNTAQQYLEAFEAAGLKLTFAEDAKPLKDIERSCLRIRDDAPPTSQPRRVRPFTYSLITLAAGSALLWLLVFIYVEGFFSGQHAPVIQVTLQYDQKKQNQIAPTPPITKPKAPKKPTAKKNAQQPQQSARAMPNSEGQSSPESGSADTPTQQRYFIQLLNWFAQSRNKLEAQSASGFKLEGEIRVRIRIARDGGVIGSKVLKSSSKALTDITLESIKHADPFPKMPASISGKDYHFTLPLRYKFEPTQ